MSYIENNLLSGESVVCRADIHWFIFIPGSMLFVLGILLFVAGNSYGPWPAVGLFLLLPLSAFLLLKATIQKATTELAVTSRRVIAKVGLIRRSTVELNHSKVESFNIDQSIFGRILGFGTLIVNGTGGGRTPIPNIDNPLAFRRQAMQSIDASQSSVSR